DAYLAGFTFSKDFPVSPGAFQTTNRFSYKGGPGPTAFVAKLDPSGSALVYSTYLDGNGDVFVTGATASADFPVSHGAYQTTNQYVVSAGACGDSCPAGVNGYNAFVTELNPAGNALIYSTYLGGN